MSLFREHFHLRALSAWWHGLASLLMATAALLRAHEATWLAAFSVATAVAIAVSRAVLIAKDASDQTFAHRIGFVAACTAPIAVCAVAIFVGIRPTTPIAGRPEVPTQTTSEIAPSPSIGEPSPVEPSKPVSIKQAPIVDRREQDDGHGAVFVDCDSVPIPIALSAEAMRDQFMNVGTQGVSWDILDQLALPEQWPEGVQRGIAVRCDVTNNGNQTLFNVTIDLGITLRDYSENVDGALVAQHSGAFSISRLPVTGTGRGASFFIWHHTPHSVLIDISQSARIRMADDERSRLVRVTRSMTGQAILMTPWPRWGLPAVLERSR